jgi:hypothetical protein
MLNLNTSHQIYNPYSHQQKASLETELLSKKNELNQLDDVDKLSDVDKKFLKTLQEVDEEVKTHESAHQSASGGLASSPSFSYQLGPDGQMYAYAGEVSISIQGGDTPEETIANMEQLKASALSPLHSSQQDLKVAQTANLMEARAKAQLDDLSQMQKKSKGLNHYNELS